VRQRKASMLRQMRLHDDQQLKPFLHQSSHTNAVTVDLIRNYGKVLAGLFGVGLILVLVYFQPALLWRGRHSETSERLVGRTILTLYPAELDIKESLPRFFLSYGA